MPQSEHDIENSQTIHYVTISKLKNSFFSFVSDPSDNPYARTFRDINKDIETFRTELGKPPKIESKRDAVKAKILQRKSLWYFIIALVLLTPLLGLVLGADENEPVPSYGTFNLDLGADTSYLISLNVLSILAAIIGAPLVYLSIQHSKTAKRLLFPSADELLDADTRPPIVYLRSFEDDDLTIKHKEENYDEDGSTTTVTHVNFEKAMSDRLGNFGPLVAIGRPGEKAPTMAASRAYFEDDKWREGISRWMDKARMIVMIPGKSQGIRWELTKILTEGHGSKLLLLFPPETSTWLSEGNEEQRRQLWQTISESLKEVPGFAGVEQLVMQDVIAVHASSSGGLVALKNSRHYERDYEKAIRLALYGLFIHDWKISERGGVSDKPTFP